MIKPVFFSFIAYFALCVSAALANSSAADSELSSLAKPKIVVSIHPLALIASSMIPEADVEVIVPSSASPHSFSLTWSDIKAIRNADLVLWVSDEFEPYMAKSVARAGRQGLVMLTDDHPSSHAHHEAADHGDHGHDDNHLWLSPADAVAFAEQLAQQLIQQRFLAQDQAQERLDKLSQAISTLKVEINPYTSSVPPVLVYHDAFSNFTDYFNFPAAFYLTHNPEQLAGIDSILQASKVIEQQGIQCALLEPQMDPKKLFKLINSHGLTTYQLDPLGHNIPIDQDGYVNFLRYLANGFAKCGGLK